MNLLRSFLVAASLVVGGTAAALTVRPPSFAELVAEAETIVRVETLASRCEWRETPRGRVIVTFVTLRVETTLKGEAAREIELRQLGGQIGEERMEIEGLPRFGVGDRDYLFIVGNGRSLCPLVGIPHGRYPIMRLAEAGDEFVARADGSPLTATAQVASPLGEGTVSLAAGQPGDAPLRAADFEAAIRAELAPRQPVAAQGGGEGSR